MEIKRYQVVPDKDVVKKQIPLIKQSGKYPKLKRIVRTLSINPYSHLFYGEKLKNCDLYSMRLDYQNRVVYKITNFPKSKIQRLKSNIIVKVIGRIYIYEVKGHYTKL